MAKGTETRLATTAHEYNLLLNFLSRPPRPEQPVHLWRLREGSRPFTVVDGSFCLELRLNETEKNNFGGLYAFEHHSAAVPALSSALHLRSVCFWDQYPVVISVNLRVFLTPAIQRQSQSARGMQFSLGLVREQASSL